MLVGTQAAGVLSSIVIARSVGPTGRGIIVTLTVWGQILGWLATLSLDKALIVLTSRDAGMVSPDQGLRTVRPPVLALSSLALVVSFLLGRHFFVSIWLTIAMAAFALATAQSELTSAWLLARGSRQAFIIWRLLQPSVYLGLLVTLALVLRSAETNERTITMGVAAAVSVLVPVTIALTVLPRRPAMVIQGLIPLLRFGAAAQVGTILQYLNGRLDLLALTILVPPKDLGYYAAGAALGQLPLLMASAGSIRGMTGETDAIDTVGIGIASLLASVVIVASPVVVPGVFGASFNPAVPIARILAIGTVINYALQGSCGRLLRRRRPWRVAFSQGVGVVVFGIGIAAFPTLLGVAWSSVSSFAVSLVIAQLALRTPNQQRAAAS
jgi:O-antigen/teichoic acid export membrane protein